MSVKRRTYLCDCPNYAHRWGFQGWCKHAIAAFLAAVECYRQQQAEGAA